MGGTASGNGRVVRDAWQCTHMEGERKSEIGMCRCVSKREEREREGERNKTGQVEYVLDCVVQVEDEHNCEFLMGFLALFAHDVPTPGEMQVSGKSFSRAMWSAG